MRIYSWYYQWYDSMIPGREDLLSGLQEDVLTDVSGYQIPLPVATVQRDVL